MDGISDAEDTDNGGDLLPAPILSSIEPSQGPAAGGTELSLSGTNFVDGASVRIGSVVASGTKVVSSTLIETITPPGSGGLVAVRVTNPDGQYSTLENAFLYVAPMQGDCSRETGCPMAEAVFQYTANSNDIVKLAGDFTGWREGAINMAHQGGGLFEARVLLKEGRYEYKFWVNDNDWRTDPNSPEQPEPFFGNSVLKHDNPCTPNLVDVLPAYGHLFTSANVTIEARYQDAEAQAGIDTNEICLVVDGRRVDAIWDETNQKIVADLFELSEGEHYWWMSAADSQGHRSAEVSGMFLVNAQGTVPQADAGPTKFVYPHEQAVLDAGWSKDPDGLGITSYQWQQTLGSNVELSSQHITPHAGYDYDSNAEPPRTNALMGFVPTQPGDYRFELVVADSDGSSAPATAQVVVLSGTRQTAPDVNLTISQDGQSLSATISSSSSPATFRWLADIKNPASLSLPADNVPILDVSADELTQEGVYFFYGLATVAGQDSLPAILMVKKIAGSFEGYNFLAPPDWIRDGVIYEIYVRAFADSNQDGFGDFQGLIEKLDYLEDLGINVLWLMPVFESADHLHGYHTNNYFRIERDYGNNADFSEFLNAAHQRGMKVVLDLVINHTSRHHPRFLDSLNPSSRYRDHYIWFEGQEGLINQYGFGRELGGGRLTASSGWADIPDTNLADPISRDWLFGVARYWLDPNQDGNSADGVDGFRLDHVTGPAHRIWQALRFELKSLKPDILLLAEVFRDFDNGGQGYGIKDYYRGEFDLAFTFPFFWEAEGIFKDTQDVRGFDGLMQAIEERFVEHDLMCFFIENHDVPWYDTVYSYWGQSVGKLIAANALMQTMPNTPQLLYGQELGTTTWRGAMPWMLDGEDNPLKNSYRQLIGLRRDNPAFRRGEYIRLDVSTAAENDVFVFARRCVQGQNGCDQDQTMIVVVNVRESTVFDVSVDLAGLAGSSNQLADLVGQGSWDIDNSTLVSRSLDGFQVFVGEID
jgi:glycosidase